MDDPRTSYIDHGTPPSLVPLSFKMYIIIEKLQDVKVILLPVYSVGCILIKKSHYPLGLVFLMMASRRPNKLTLLHKTYVHRCAHLLVFDLTVSTVVQQDRVLKLVIFLYTGYKSICGCDVNRLLVYPNALPKVYELYSKADNIPST